MDVNEDKLTRKESTKAKIITELGSHVSYSKHTNASAMCCKTF